MPASPGAASKPEKTMSSRLLTMKFMQRAAASAAAKEIPTSGSGSDEGVHTPKRPRLSTEAASPGTPQSDLDAIAAALAAEEEKRREAVARQAAEAGETQWVLDIPAATQYASQPLVVAADSLDAMDDVPQGGRRSYGNFKRKPKTSQTSEEIDDTEMMDPADPDQVKAMIKQAKAKSEKKRVKLSQLTSISGAGGSPRQSMGGSLSSKKKKKRKST